MLKLMKWIAAIERRVLLLHGRLKERHLYRLMLFYIGVVGLILNGAGIVVPALRLPDWSLHLLIWVAVVGLPVVLTVGLLASPPRPRSAGASATRGGASDPPLQPPGSGNAGALAPGLATLVVVIIAVLLLAGIALAGDLPKHHDGSRQTIAVLPFTITEPLRLPRSTADDLHSEVVSALGQIGELRVTSRTSVARFKQRERSTVETARLLKVGVVLMAEVQQQEDRLLMSAELIDSVSAQPFWVRTYNVNAGDRRRLQRALVRDVTRALGIKLSFEERRRLRIAEPDSLAYAYYRAAINLERSKSDPTLDESQEVERLYRAATDRDPTFALALARLSRLSSRMVMAGLDRSAKRRALAAQMADSALAVDPDVPEVHVARGLFYYWVQREYELARRELESAGEALPSDSEIQAALGYIYRRIGNWDEALDHLRRAADLDPLVADRYAELGYTHQARREYRDADAAFRRAFQLDSGFHSVEVERGELWVAWQGNTDTLVSVLARVPLEVDPDGEITLSRVQTALLRRDPALALRILDTVEGDTLTGQMYFYPIAFLRAIAHRIAGDSAAAHADAVRAITRLEAALRSDRLNAWARITLARAYALVGRHAEALREANRAKREVMDAFFGPRMRYEVAVVHAATGDAASAALELTSLLQIRAGYTPHQIRLDPAWDSVRDTPAFAALQHR